MSYMKATITILLAGAVGCGGAQTQTPDVPDDDEEAVEETVNREWVVVSGEVTDTTDTTFTLDYGEGTVAVEMDDWDMFPEARTLLVDDDVIVYGYIDDDFFERRTLEAGSVYVEDLGTQLYASGVDEEDMPRAEVALVDYDPVIELTGTVTDVSTDEFALDTGHGTVDVNVERMSYQPLDDEGFQRITVGERVRVVGQLGSELFADYDLFADTVITLSEDTAG